MPSYFDKRSRSVSFSRYERETKFQTRESIIERILLGEDLFRFHYSMNVHKQIVAIVKYKLITVDEPVMMGLLIQ